ncbi:hypothetical protein [Silvibacterium sp.]|uniref:glycosyl-4,4'-diaponeurosporenoate acyltransferase CrtO family protein n=1 Tax=Silvibacterium sp. TaxID=1964179 RepID=UPI0039E49103
MSPARVILLNCIGWPALQLSLAWGMGCLPARWFAKEAAWSRVCQWESPLYRRVLRLRSWKHRLPDGASWFAGGFAKKKLEMRNREYLMRFVAETRRGELAHWLMIACVPLFFVWNPPWACVVVAFYALIANLPCIIVQRYNRATLLRVPKNTYRDKAE